MYEGTKKPFRDDPYPMLVVGWWISPFGKLPEVVRPSLLKKLTIRMFFGWDWEDIAEYVP